MKYSLILGSAFGAYQYPHPLVIIGVALITGALFWWDYRKRQAQKRRNGIRGRMRSHDGTGRFNRC